LQVSGRGRHRLAVRAYNARVTGVPERVDLRSASPRRFELEVAVEDEGAPWIVCVVPDGRSEDRAEIDGPRVPALERHSGTDA
jgi:hypothetical protein